MSGTTERSCPVCAHPLAAVTLRGARVLACATGDHGGWLPAGVLERALAGLKPRKRTSPPAFREDAVGSLGQGTGACPDDGAPLERVIWGDAVFERCVRCRGLWAGADALRTIVAEVRGERVAPRPRDPEESVILAILASIL